MTEFVRQVEHTARKPHRCIACERTIFKGARYQRWSGKRDGQFDSVAYHPECREWEVKVNREAGHLVAGEWMTLAEHVHYFGAAILNGAPDIVRARMSAVLRREAP